VNCELATESWLSGSSTEVVRGDREDAPSGPGGSRGTRVGAGLIKPGVTTLDLEKAAEARTKELGAKAAFKGYHGFPCVLCTSVNSEVVHGIPSAKRVLQEGEIVSVDYGAFVDGYCGDAAITVLVGEKIDPQTARLVKVTEASLDAAIAAVKPGATLGDVGFAVQKVVEAAGFSVVRDFVGHGIGVHMHEDPQVPNFGEAGRGMKLRAGMVIAIEPMVNAASMMSWFWTTAGRQSPRMEA